MSIVSNLFKIYRSNGNVLEIFSLFRSEIIKYYQNEYVGRFLRMCWNYNMLNELDVLDVRGLDEKYIPVANEFIYYMKIIYERYLIFPEKNMNSKHNFNSCVKIGNKNIISVDCQHSFFYEKKYYGNNILDFLNNNLCMNLDNIILTSRPIIYKYKSQEESMTILSCLFDFLNKNKDTKINIISFHKNGDSFVQTHYYDNKQIVENVCSGFNNADCHENKLKLRMKLYFAHKFSKMKKCCKKKKEKIQTTNFAYFGLNNNITIIINNFILNVHI